MILKKDVAERRRWEKGAVGHILVGAFLLGRAEIWRDYPAMGEPLLIGAAVVLVPFQHLT